MGSRRPPPRALRLVCRLLQRPGRALGRAGPGHRVWRWLRQPLAPLQRPGDSGLPGTHTIIEFTHRMMTGGSTFLVLGLLIWTLRTDLARPGCTRVRNRCNAAAVQRSAPRSPARQAGLRRQQPVRRPHGPAFDSPQQHPAAARCPHTDRPHALHRAAMGRLRNSAQPGSPPRDCSPPSSSESAAQWPPWATRSSPPAASPRHSRRTSAPTAPSCSSSGSSTPSAQSSPAYASCTWSRAPAPRAEVDSSPPVQCAWMGSAVLWLLGVQFLLGIADVLLLAPAWMQILHLLGADLFWVTLVSLAARTVWPQSVSADNCSPSLKPAISPKRKRPGPMFWVRVCMERRLNLLWPGLLYKT